MGCKIPPYKSKTDWEEGSPCVICGIPCDGGTCSDMCRNALERRNERYQWDYETEEV